MDVAFLEVMSFGGYDLGDCELLDIPDLGGIDLWRLQFWRFRALEVTVLEFLILTHVNKPFAGGVAYFETSFYFWQPATP